jgi:hypothetical protein
VTPIVHGDSILVSAGYGRGSELFKLTAKGLESVYVNTNISNEASNGVLYNNCVFGPAGELGQKGKLACMEFATGVLKWEHAGVKVGGGAIAVGGKLLHMEYDGSLSVVDAVADGYRELGRVKLPRGEYGTMPVLSNGRIYCRTIKGDVFCLNVGPERDRQK